MLSVFLIAKESLKVCDQMVPACHRAHRLWMTKGKKVRDHMVPACHRARRLWMTKGEKVRDQMVPVCHRAHRLWMTKDAEDDVSLCVLSCFES